MYFNNYFRIQKLKIFIFATCQDILLNKMLGYIIHKSYLKNNFKIKILLGKNYFIFLKIRYERALSIIPCSLEIWIEYCNFAKSLEKDKYLKII